MPADKAHYKGEGAFGWRDPDRIHLIDSFYLDHGRWRRSARSGRRSPRFKHEPVDSGEESVAMARSMCWAPSVDPSGTDARPRRLCR
jgi:hypothetical protein